MIKTFLVTINETPFATVTKDNVMEVLSDELYAEATTIDVKEIT